MKKSFKSYLALVPGLYRWGMLFAVPVVLLAANAVLEYYLGFRSVLLCVWLYGFLDLFLDYWVFGGICSKSGSRMDYVKSSFYGCTLLKNGLIGDEVRRLAGMAVVAFGTMGYYCIAKYSKITPADLTYIGIMAFLPFFLNTAALNIVRYINILVWHYSVSFLVSSFSMGLLAGMGMVLYGAEPTGGHMERVLAWFFTSLLVLSAAAFALTIRHMLYKVKKSYLDEG